MMATKAERRMHKEIEGLLAERDRLREQLALAKAAETTALGQVAQAIGRLTEAREDSRRLLTVLEKLAEAFHDRT